MIPRIFDRASSVLAALVLSMQFLAPCASSCARDYPGAHAEREVRYASAGIELAGTILLPDSAGPHPAVLFLLGSGDHARDPILPLARRFADQGVVSLAFDKRGTGASGGDWQEATLDDLARDAQAGLDFLRAQPSVDAARVGVFVASQGAWVACALAEHGGRIDFLIAASGGGVTPREAERWSYSKMLSRAALGPEQERRALDLVDRYFACLEGKLDKDTFLRELDDARAEPFFAALRLERIVPFASRRDRWSWVADFDPREGASRLRGPALVLLGEEDDLQPSELAARRWREALARGGNRAVTVRIFPGVGHYLRNDEGASDPHAAPYLPEVLETLDRWLQTEVTAGIRPPGELLIRDVSLVDTDAGVILPHRNVLIRGARIAEVTAGDDATASAPTRIIEGRGLFLIPGLIDAHVHSSGRDLPLFLANGVTTIRELNGSPGHLDLRARIATGELVGPRMIVSSPLLAGSAQRWRHILLVDPDAAARRVEMSADEGYDAIKIYDGLTPEVYQAIAAAARRRTLPLVGHIPHAVGLEGVLAAHQSIEHTEQILQATVGHDLDPAKISGIVDAIRRAGVAVTPTLAAQRFLGAAGKPEFTARLALPQMAYVQPQLRSWWESVGGHAVAQAVEGKPNPYFEFQARLVLELSRAGVPFLVGTDTPNPLLVPGFSVHDELDTLVAAGLSREQVLRAATVGAAGILALGAQGRIAPGQVADLVLLDADPFTSLETLRHPKAVCAAGRWIDRVQLEAMIAPLAPKAQ